MPVDTLNDLGKSLQTDYQAWLAVLRLSPRANPRDWEAVASLQVSAAHSIEDIQEWIALDSWLTSGFFAAPGVAIAPEPGSKADDPETGAAVISTLPAAAILPPALTHFPAPRAISPAEKFTPTPVGPTHVVDASRAPQPASLRGGLRDLAQVVSSATPDLLNQEDVEPAPAAHDADNDNAEQVEPANNYDDMIGQVSNPPMQAERDAISPNDYGVFNPSAPTARDAILPNEYELVSNSPASAGRDAILTNDYDGVSQVSTPTAPVGRDANLPNDYDNHAGRVSNPPMQAGQKTSLSHENKQTESLSYNELEKLVLEMTGTGQKALPPLETSTRPSLWKVLQLLSSPRLAGNPMVAAPAANLPFATATQAAGRMNLPVEMPESVRRMVETEPIAGSDIPNFSEIDVQDLLDALKREVWREYERFYGPVK